MTDFVAVSRDDLAPSASLSSARAIVESARIDKGSEPHRAQVLAFIDDHPDALHRSCTEGHLTGSALVVDPSTERLVVLFHKKLQLWVQPGGHADGDANLAAVALREASEETGIEGLRVASPAVDIDVHRVSPPGERPHLHLDVRHLVVAPAGAAVRGNHESEAISWVAVDELDGLGADDGLRRLAGHGLEAWRNSTASGAWR